jgi:hypothetical protein
MKWAYAVTTVLRDRDGNLHRERRDEYLPRTLASLKAGGFAEPTLFVDGCDFAEAAEYERRFSLRVEASRQRLGVVGNWVRALWTLRVLEPGADLYLMAQDDFVCARNLRQYLERCEHPAKGYWNGYLFASNESYCPKDAHGQPLVGWYESRDLRQDGTDIRWQTGRGGLLLVFSREAVTVLLSSRSLAEKPMHASMPHKKLDGAVVTAMNFAGYREMVHFPSLTQHIGEVSSCGNHRHAKATSFPGENVDALTLLESHHAHRR